MTGFEALIRFIYTGDEKVVAVIKDLDLLFEIYHLADKVTEGLYIKLHEPELDTRNLTFFHINLHPPPPAKSLSQWSQREGRRGGKFVKSFLGLWI